MTTQLDFGLLHDGLASDPVLNVEESSLLRVCYICKKTLPLQLFPKSATNKTGGDYRCKPCADKITKTCSICKITFECESNFTRKKGTTRYHSACKNCCCERNKRYNKLNKQQRRLWRDQQKDKENADRNEKRSIRLRTDANYKIKRAVHARLARIATTSFYGGSSLKDMGCTTQQIKTHLENQFKEGMSWSNHGLHGWHIDHIRPLSSFDLTDRDQLLQAIHYTNLQPLWAEENLSKGSNYDPT